MSSTVFGAFDSAATEAPDRMFLCVPAAAGRAYHPDGLS